MDLGRLSLRERERGFVAGGTQVGKSTLCYLLVIDFVQRYAHRGGRCLILDTKPRFRAQWLPNGTSAKHLYRKWSHGQFVPGSVVVRDVDEMRSAFKLGHRIVVAQADSDRDVPRLVAIARAFLMDSKRTRPQVIYVDETKDFYHGNGMPVGSDAISRTARAGAERGTAGLYGSQRTKGLDVGLLEHMEKLYAFRLDARADAKRFAEFGAPIGPADLPTKPFRFLYWTKMDYGRVWGPYMLEPPPGSEAAPSSTPRRLPATVRG